MYKKLNLDVNSSIDRFDQDYYLMKKKIYSRRYATDGYSLFFKEKYQDIREYMTIECNSIVTNQSINESL